MFMGTPAFAVPALHAVARACDVVAVVTQPDRPSGRGRKLAAAPVAEAAAALGIETMKPADANGAETAAALAALNPDLFAVVAFGAILSPALLRLPARGSINLHGSLLPEYRGASPVQRALWDGRVATGVTTLWMDEGIDTGDVILQRWVAIEPEDDAGALAAKLAEAGAPLLAESLVLAHEGRAPRRAQDRAAGSYAKKLAKEDGRVDWARDADSVWQRQRAVTPWPGAVTWFRGHPLTLLATRPEHRLPMELPAGSIVEVAREAIAVACVPGVLRVTRLKPEARGAMDAGEWARGARVSPGDRFDAAAPPADRAGDLTESRAARGG